MSQETPPNSIKAKFLMRKDNHLIFVANGKNVYFPHNYFYNKDLDKNADYLLTETKEGITLSKWNPN